MVEVEKYEILVEKYDPIDRRLGRHVRHDSRSLRFLVRAGDVNELQSIRHDRFIPILNQGDIGSCTGNAATHCIGSGAFWNSEIVQNIFSNLDETQIEAFAVSVYAEATSLDSYDGFYPPTDTGSDGLSVAKVLQNHGLISGYQHAISLDAVLTALASQPLIVGTAWNHDMFTPDSDGRLRITGETAGGHEYMLDALDVENRLVWMCNSWGVNWGVNGRAYLTWDDLATLLNDNGDCTVFTPVDQLAPIPDVPSDDPIGDLKFDLLKLSRTMRRKSIELNQKLVEFYHAD